MGTARQIVRWSIPGTVFIAVAILSSFILAVSSGYTVADLLTSTLVRMIDTGFVLLVAISGVPVGFLIYQLYYSRQSKGIVFPPLPFIPRLPFVKADPGSKFFGVLPGGHHEHCKRVLGELPIIWDLKEVNPFASVPVLKYVPLINDITLLRLQGRRGDGNPTSETASRARFLASPPTQGCALHDFTSYRERNRHLFKSYMAHVSASYQAPDLKEEYTTLLDLYHAMGACRMAAVLAGLATVGGSLLAYFTESLPGLQNPTVGIVLIVLFVATLFLVLSSTRGLSLQSAIYTVEFDMRRLVPQHELELGNFTSAGYM